MAIRKPTEKEKLHTFADPAEVEARRRADAAAAERGRRVREQARKDPLAKRDSK